MKKNYINPSVKLITIQTNDIIALSFGDKDTTQQGWGDGNGNGGELPGDGSGVKLSGEYRNSLWD